MKNFLLNGKHLIVVAIFLLSGLSFAFTPKKAQLDKITICHTPPGNPGNCHEITISLDALEAHLNHGDDLICHHPEELSGYTDIWRTYLSRMPSATTLLVKSY